jgi:ArsR family transcriptional regulator
MDTRNHAPGCCVVCEIDSTPSADRQATISVFRALGDPTRYEIFRLIAAQSDQICVCHITDRFEVSQPTISHHLRVLREAGLITVSRRGTWAYYEVDPRGLERLREAIGAFQFHALSGVA